MKFVSLFIYFQNFILCLINLVKISTSALKSFFLDFCEKLIILMVYIDFGQCILDVAAEKRGHMKKYYWISLDGTNFPGNYPHFRCF